MNIHNIIFGTMIQHLWSQVVSRSRFLARAKDRHSVHSPYLADFIDQVFLAKKLPNDVGHIEDLRKDILRSKEVIEVEDLGAGSHKTKGRLRNVSEIGRYALKKQKDAAILFRTAEYLKAKTILEMGTSLGTTSLYLSSVPNSQVFTMEGCPNTLALAEDHFAQFGRQNITSILGDFYKTLPELLERIDSIDLAFVDGNHQKEPTLFYFELLLPKLHNNSLLVFDDIHWSPEMEAAWETIKADPRTIITVDIHRMGFVFFRKEMTAKHFDLRY